jgi:uncharacterized protein YecE (DUF72 family)
VPDDFRFAAKVPRAITHDKALVDCEDELTAFLDTMEALEDRLGPLLFQFPPDWTAYQGEESLRQLLPTLPADRQFAMEFRHESWFQDRFAELLHEYSIAWTLADVGHFVPQVYVTAPFAYIRWLGNRYDETLKPYNSVKKDREAEEEHWAHIIADCRCARCGATSIITGPDTRPPVLKRSPRVRVWSAANFPKNKNPAIREHFLVA